MLAMRILLGIGSSMTDNLMTNDSLDHDPLCPELWRWAGTPCMFCALVSRVREDERSAALQDAVDAFKALEMAVFESRDPWGRAIRAINALGGKR